jgi:hypothetical protein
MTTPAAAIPVGLLDKTMTPAEVSGLAGQDFVVQSSAVTSQPAHHYRAAPSTGFRGSASQPSIMNRIRLARALGVRL